jgi:hypothetical protein
LLKRVLLRRQKSDANKRPSPLARRQRTASRRPRRAGAVFHKGKLLERPSDITPSEPTDNMTATTEIEVA